MKLNEVLAKLGADKAMEIAKKEATFMGIDWDGGVKYIFDIIANDCDRAPGNIGGDKDDEETVIRKWLLKYENGYASRASKRTSKQSCVKDDPIIEKIISARLQKLTKDDLGKIIYGHRIGMAAENVLGLILEEYLCEQLRPYGWHCAWGSTIKSVDFVNKNGELLQIKNRSNSENSSSSSVRKGTKIKKWYRVEAKDSRFMWDKLNEICGTGLSEEAFIKYAQELLEKNPGCLAIIEQSVSEELEEG